MALALAERGARVAIHYRSSREQAEAVAAAARACDVQAWTVQGDLADPQQVAGVVEQALDAAGGLDILVHSAGIFPPSPLLETPADEVHRLVQVNALAAVQLARAFAAQGRPGSIVNLLDARSLTDHDPPHAAYHASKRMLFTFTRMLAVELAPRIRVNAIAPGLILPPPGEDESYLERLAEANPLHAVGSPDDIVRALLYLVDSPFVTGEVLYVDGGRHLRGAVYG
jgi:NAD(P)-dependent dehydrogenase (short-subunit alcohol dehydrogenase family)